MEKIALITDTTSDLDNEFIKSHNIKVLPFRIIYKDREYRDRFEITSQQVYDKLKEEVPTSSMPSLDDMENVFVELEKEGYTYAIAITLSVGLSGIYNGVKVVSESHPDICTFVCDSQSISSGEGALVEECAKLIDEGRSFNEIVEEIPKIKKRIHLFFVIGTLEYLKKGGRIGKVSGTIAELLNIKPIISVDEEGKYYTYDKVRGRKQSLNKLIEICKEICNNKKCKAYVSHGDSYEDAQKVYEVVKNVPNIVSASFGADGISPVSGVHSGPQLVGLVLVEEP